MSGLKKASPKFSSILKDIKTSSLNEKLKGRNYKIYMKNSNTVDKHFLIKKNINLFEEKEKKLEKKREYTKEKPGENSINNISGNKIDINISVNYNKQILSNSQLCSEQQTISNSSNILNKTNKIYKQTKINQLKENSLINDKKIINDVNMNNSSEQINKTDSKEKLIKSLKNINNKIEENIRTNKIIMDYNNNEHKRNQSEDNFLLNYSKNYLNDENKTQLDNYYQQYQNNSILNNELLQNQSIPNESKFLFFYF